MNKTYDVFISCERHDDIQIAEMLSDELSRRNIENFYFKERPNDFDYPDYDGLYYYDYEPVLYKLVVLVWTESSNNRNQNIFEVNKAYGILPITALVTGDFLLNGHLHTMIHDNNIIYNNGSISESVTKTVDLIEKRLKQYNDYLQNCEKFTKAKFRCLKTSELRKLPDEEFIPLHFRKLKTKSQLQNYSAPPYNRLHKIVTLSEYFNWTYGYVNTKGKMLIPFKFTSAEPFKNGFAKVSNARRFFYIDKTGKEIKKEDLIKLGFTDLDSQKKNFTFDNYDSLNDSEDDEFNEKTLNSSNQDLFGLSDDIIDKYKPCKTYGVCDGVGIIAKRIKKRYTCYVLKFSGEQICKFICDEINEGINGQVIVGVDNKYGVIRANNIIEIPLEYDSLQCFPLFNPKCYMVKKDGKVGLVSLKGETIIPNMYDNLALCDSDDLYIVEKDNKFGVIDKNNKEIIPLLYDRIHVEKGNYFVRSNCRYGILSRDGKFIVPLIYDKIDDFFRSNYLLVKSKGKVGYLNQDGSTFIPVIYDDIKELANGHFVAVDGKKYSLIDKQGKLLFTTDKEIKEVCDVNFYYVFKKQKYGIMDDNGNIIVPVKYKKLLSRRFAYTFNNKWVVLDENGQISGSNELNNISEINKYFYVATNENGLRALLSKDGKQLTPFKYHAIKELDIDISRYGNDDKKDETYFAVLTSDGWGCIDAKGKELVPCKYLSVDYDDDKVYTYEFCKTTVYDKDMNVLISVSNEITIRPHTSQWNGHQLTMTKCPKNK